MDTTRREFIEYLGIAGIVSLGGRPPRLFQRALAAADAEGKRADDGRVLVLVQLSGGNDGLNTVIPHGDDAYYRNRPGIGVGKGAVLKIDDYLGLHPQMSGMKELYDDGALAILQGVGYPNPNRSHFRSMDIWHSAIAEEERIDTGWLGRSLDARSAKLAGRLPALTLGFDRVPLALVGEKVNVPNIRDLSRYQLRIGGGPDADQKRRRRLMDRLAQSDIASSNHELDFLRRTAVNTYQSIDRFHEVAANYTPAHEYPRTGLGEKLKLIAQMVAGGFETEIYYVALNGFDTHSQQQGAHNALLKELSDALRAFHLDLKGHHLAERVLTVTFSEFGRRVKENGSLGTDHGTASQMFVVTPTGKAGVHGSHPSLADLEQGDLTFHTDFRQVYATLLEKWLGVPAEPVLGKRYETLDFV